MMAIEKDLRKHHALSESPDVPLMDSHSNAQSMDIPAIIQDVSAQILHHDGDCPSSLQIRIPDREKLHSSLDEFFGRLDSRASKKTVFETLAAQSHQHLDDILAGLAEIADDPKDLSPENEAHIAEMLSVLPKKFVRTVELLWSRLLGQLAILAENLYLEGVAHCASVEGRGFRANTGYVRQIVFFFEIIIDAQKKDLNDNPQIYSNLQREQYQFLSLSIEQKIGNEKPPYGVNFEDIIDTHVDDALFQNFLTELRQGHHANDLAEQYSFAFHNLLSHLAGSLALQKVRFFEDYLDDLQKGREDEPDYYSTNDMSLFEHEEEALTALLANTSRVVSGLTRFGRLAKIFRAAPRIPLCRQSCF